MKPIIAVGCLTLAVGAFSGCGGSEAPADVPGGSAAAGSQSTPAHNYKNLPELEAALTAQWTKAFTNPSDAHYVGPDVTLKSVHCTPDKTADTLFYCIITPTKGEPTRFGYLVSADGQSYETKANGV